MTASKGIRDMKTSLWIRCSLLICLLTLVAGCPGPVQEPQSPDQNKADASTQQPADQKPADTQPAQPATKSVDPGSSEATKQEERSAQKDMPQQEQTPSTTSDTPAKEAAATETPAVKEQPAGRVSAAAAADVTAARELIESLGSTASCTIVPDGVLTAISVEDGSTLKVENLALFGRLTDLESLEILNFRDMNDEAAAQLSGLKNLKTLALTNSAIGDRTVEMIVASFPALTSLDLSSNTNLTSGVLKTIATLEGLERLSLLQNRFNDISALQLGKLQQLKVLDLRGNMTMGDLTFRKLGALPKLTVLKHRSSTVSDRGLAGLAASESLKSLLLQDARISSDSGPEFAKMKSLRELEIFRCVDFGSPGVLALKGTPLTRLQLRGFPQSRTKRWWCSKTCLKCSDCICRRWIRSVTRGWSA